MLLGSSEGHLEAPLCVLEASGGAGRRRQVGLREGGGPVHGYRAGGFGGVLRVTPRGFPEGTTRVRVPQTPQRSSKDLRVPQRPSKEGNDHAEPTYAVVQARWRIRNRKGGGGTKKEFRGFRIKIYIKK